VADVVGQKPCYQLSQILHRHAPLSAGGYDMDVSEMLRKDAARADRALYSSQHLIRTMDHQQRIRELCTKAIAITDPQQFEQVLAELSLAFHEHADQMRKNETVPREESLPHCKNC
jgi:hypothetical protein